jgi:hypothetical protein
MKKQMISVLVLVSMISFFGISVSYAGITMGSSMYLPDKGVRMGTSYNNYDNSYNNGRSAWADFYGEIFNTGECGHYFEIERVQVEVSPFYGDDPGLRRFDAVIEFYHRDVCPAIEEFDYSIRKEYREEENDFEIRIDGSIYNDSDYYSIDDEYFRVPNANIRYNFSLGVYSSSAEIQYADTEFYTRENYNGEMISCLRMQGTFHTPEPATLSLLSAGFAFVPALRRRK